MIVKEIHHYVSRLICRIKLVKNYKLKNYGHVLCRF